MRRTRTSGSQRPLAAVLWALLFLGACGTTGDESGKEDDGDDRVVTEIVPSKMSSDPNQKLTKIPISFGTATTFSLTATPVDAFEIQLTNCLSGYTATVTTANVDGLEVYSADRNCLAKLTEFEFEGRTYVPTAADPFTTWQEGDTAVFDEVGEPGNFPLNLIIGSTLSSPVLGGDTIEYGVYDLLAGSGKEILGVVIGASSQVSNGSDAPPSFSVKSVQFVGLSEDGAGKYEILMQCSVTIGATDVCNGVSMADIDYKLLEDIYDADGPDLTECDTAFGTQGDVIALPGQRVAPGDQGMLNGGFVTVTLTGPITLATKPNMMLILQSYHPTGSYQFFNLDVTVSTP